MSHRPVISTAILLFLALFARPASGQGAGDGAGPPGGFIEAMPPEFEVLRLFADRKAVRPGGQFRVAIEARLAHGWHVYAPDSENAPPTVLDFKGAIQPASFLWPEPASFDLFGETYRGYEETFVAVAFFRVPAEVGESIDLRGALGGQVCSEAACIDLKQPFRLVIPVARGTETEEPAEAALFQAFPFPGESAAPKAGETTPAPTDSPGDGAQAGKAEGSAFEDSLDRGLLLALLFAYLAGLAASLTPCVYPIIPVTIGYFVNQVTPVNPDTIRRYRERKGMSAAALAEAVEVEEVLVTRWEAGEESPKPAKAKKLKAVLEMSSRGRTFLLACVYVLGIALSYALLGMAFSLAGRDLGSVLDDPKVVAGISIVLLFLAGAMFGFYELRLPAALTARLEGGSRKAGGVAGTFLLGSVLGMVAAPCVGPFAGAILIYVAAKGVLVGTLALFAFGLGLGTLFLFVAIFSEAIPQSGAWLDRVKQFFAFVLLLLIVSFWSTIVPAAAVAAAAGAIFVLWGAVTGAFDPISPEAGTRARALKGFGLILVLFGAYLLLAPLLAGGLNFAGLKIEGLGAGRSPARAEVAWVNDPAALKDVGALARSRGKPVLVDFWAKWCAACNHLDRVVFDDPEVRDFLSRRFVVVRGDCTQGTSEATRIRREVYGRAQIPFVAVHDREGRYREDLSARLSERAASESLTAREFLEILRDL